MRARLCAAVEARKGALQYQEAPPHKPGERREWGDPLRLTSEQEFQAGHICELNEPLSLREKLEHGLELQFPRSLKLIFQVPKSPLTLQRAPAIWPNMDST